MQYIFYSIFICMQYKNNTQENLEVKVNLDAIKGCKIMEKCSFYKKITMRSR